jgi:hypothetical protein
MNDSDYILSKIKTYINDGLNSVTTRLVQGNIQSMEEYKFNLGMRSSLTQLKNNIYNLEITEDK